ncbi:alanyl-tRNA editing protein [Methanocella sp. CWC-04]|uniref:Alanyl-tRNA editing protein n=2 Tax=Methanooceanicella nereidis TaxID=2052831 RepID=A0AAP2REJ4_9EURY|nr:alanyl-tRNA editing protein [Methanocella sp. CWC-04]
MVELEDTYFFPRGGGQVGDQGTINGIKVVDTVYEDGRIIHVMENEPPFKTGDLAACAIDWDKRYRRMRLHSASHIVHYLMGEVFGNDCKAASSGLLDEEKERTDFLFDVSLDREKLMEVENRTNSIIAQDLEIRSYRDEADPETLVWEMGNWKMLCCGTHPRRSGEIGPIRLVRGKKPGKGRERIEIHLA